MDAPAAFLMLSPHKRLTFGVGIPLKRFGKPSDISNLVVFLAGENASYITGQVINVCGGMVI